MKPLKIHYLQHVAFEGLGCIAVWASQHGAILSSTEFYRDDYLLPSPDDFDWLIIMGGPMGVYDHAEHPWLLPEKELIKQAIVAGKKVLGICLGAQLIATVLGARVWQNHCKEMGWFDINYMEGVPRRMKHHNAVTVFHWHGDTFDIPTGAVHIASSIACHNQGFLYNNNVLALQYHMEITEESLDAMLAYGADELKPDKYIQPADVIKGMKYYIAENNKMMFNWLNYLAS